MVPTHDQNLKTVQLVDFLELLRTRDAGRGTRDTEPHYETLSSAD